MIKNSLLKSIGIIAGGVCLSMLFWYAYLGEEWGAGIVIFWNGVPAGLISGVLFLIINKYILLRKPRKGLLAIQGAIFVLLLATTSALIHRGGDILFYISRN